MLVRKTFAAVVALSLGPFAAARANDFPPPSIALCSCTWRWHPLVGIHVMPGDIILITVEAQNLSETPVRNVEIVATIPEGTEFVEIGPRPGYSDCTNVQFSGGVVRCTSPSVSAFGGFAMFSYRVRVNEATKLGTVLRPTASLVSSTPPSQYIGYVSFTNILVSSLAVIPALQPFLIVLLAGALAIVGMLRGHAA